MFTFGKSSLKEQRKVTLWLKKYIGNPDESKVQMVVKEVNCTDPDCVPIETVCVLVNSDNNDRWIGKILKPLNEVIFDDMKSLNIPNQWFTDNNIHNIDVDNYYDTNRSTPFITDTINKLKDYLINLNNETEQDIVIDMFENLFEEVRLNKLPITSQVIINNTITANEHSLEIKSNMNSVTMKEEKVEVKEMPKEVEEEDDELMDVVMIDMEAAPPLPKAINVTSQSSSIVSEGDTRTNVPASSSSSSRRRRSTSTSTSRSNSRADQFGRSRPQIRDTTSSMPTKRHDKGIRPRGCPCCDPDNLENLVDRILYMDSAI